MADEPRGIAGGGRAVLADGRVERLACHVRRREEGDEVLDAGANGHRKMRGVQREVDEALKLGGQFGGLFGRDVEAEGFYGDQAVAFRVVRAENGTQNARTDLVQEFESTEGRRRRVGGP